MEITEVRIKLMEDSEDRLRAFCSVTFDHSFVVRDLKIIEGTSSPFVAMPSRKLTGRCGKCGYKNHLRSNYCNQCGIRLRGGHDLKDSEANSNRLYADIAHPINQACRDLIQQAVIREYHIELERAKLPGYKSRYDDDYFETPVPLPPAAESSAGAYVQGGPPKPHFDAAPSNRVNAGTGQAHIDTPESDPNAGSESFGRGILDEPN
jgi:stage V sporulation protein G